MVSVPEESAGRLNEDDEPETTLELTVMDDPPEEAPTLLEDTCVSTEEDIATSRSGRFGKFWFPQATRLKATHPARAFKH
jgi:hypothetical protein